MQREEFERMDRLEDSLWWYRGMQAIARRLIERCYARGAGLRILDAGCGTGAALNFLTGYGTVTGVDVEHFALQLARRRGHTRLAQASAAALPLPAASFDLAVCFDVLQMLDAEAETVVLAEISRALAPGGRLLLRVAAGDWLRGAHDRLWMVKRRYGPAGVRQRLWRAGLEVEHLSHANMWLFPAAAVKRLAERVWAPGSDHSDLEYNFGPLNGLLTGLLASEAPLVAGPGLPVGLSLFALARKGGRSER